MKPTFLPSSSGTAVHLSDESEYKFVKNTSGPNPGYTWVITGPPPPIRRTGSGHLLMAPRAQLERDGANQHGYIANRHYDLQTAPGSLGLELAFSALPPLGLMKTMQQQASFLQLPPMEQPLPTDAAGGAQAATAVPPHAAPDIPPFNAATYANAVSQAEEQTVNALDAWMDALLAGDVQQIASKAQDVAAWGQAAWRLWPEWVIRSDWETQHAQVDAEPETVDVEEVLGEPPRFEGAYMSIQLARNAAGWADKMAAEQEEARVSLNAFSSMNGEDQAMQALEVSGLMTPSWKAWHGWATRFAQEFQPSTSSAQACRERLLSIAQKMFEAAGRGGYPGGDRPAGFRDLLPVLPSECGAGGYQPGAHGLGAAVLPQPLVPEPRDVGLLRRPDLAGIPLNEVFGRFCLPDSAAGQKDWSAPGLFMDSRQNDMTDEVAHLLMRAFTIAERQPAAPSSFGSAGEAPSLMHTLQALAERLSTSDQDRHWLADLATDANAACDSLVGVSLGSLLMAGKLRDLHDPGARPADGLGTLLLHAAAGEMEAGIRDLLEGQEAVPSAELLLTGFHHLQQVLHMNTPVPIPSVFPENILFDADDEVHFDAVRTLADNLCWDLYRPNGDDNIRHPLDEIKRLLPGERVLGLLRKHGGEHFEQFFRAHHGHDVETSAAGVWEKMAALDDPGMALSSQDHLDRSEALKLEYREHEDRVYSAAINRLLVGYGSGWSRTQAGSSGSAPA